MSILEQFDFARGELPPWLAPLVSLTRPLAVSLTGMLIPVGAFTCGAVALFSAEAGLRMAAASSAFLHGIPEPLYYLVGGVFGIYSVSKSAEVIKAPAPAGGVSPERPLQSADHAAKAEAEAHTAPAAPAAEVDAAPRSRS